MYPSEEDVCNFASAVSVPSKDCSKCTRKYFGADISSDFCNKRYMKILFKLTYLLSLLTKIKTIYKNIFSKQIILFRESIPNEL